MIVSLVYRELKSVLRLFNYYRQGLKVRYIPILGKVWLFVTPGEDSLLRLRKIVLDLKEEKAVAINCLQTKSGVMILLIRPETICEFLKKETKFCQRNLPKDLEVGFFTEPTHSALVARNAFASFFSVENTEKLYSKMYNSAEKLLNKYEKKWKLNNKEWKMVDCEPLLKEMFLELANWINFGDQEEEEEDLRLSDGTPISVAIAEYFDLFIKVLKNPYNILTLDLYRKLRIGSINRRFHFIDKEINRVVMKIYKKHEQIIRSKLDKPDKVNENEKKALCLIDLLVANNIKCEQENNIKDVFDEKKIIGNVKIFQLASFQTSYDT